MKNGLDSCLSVFCTTEVLITLFAASAARSCAVVLYDTFVSSFVIETMKRVWNVIRAMHAAYVHACCKIIASHVSNIGYVGTRTHNVRVSFREIARCLSAQYA